MHDATVSSSVSHFAGIDVSKHTLEVFIDRTVSNLTPVRCTVANTPQEITGLVRSLIQHNVCLVVIEATGRYHRQLTAALLEGGVPVKVLNPQRAREFARATGKLEKTHSIDAPVLAHYARSINPAPSTPADPKQVEIADLISRRRALVQQRIAETNRSGEKMPKLAQRQSKAMLRLIQKQIDDLDLAIAKAVEAHDDWNNKSKIIDSVPGIGPDSANQLAIAVPELGKLNRGQIAKLIGVAPLANESGHFKGKRTIKGGRGDIRTILYMLAHNAVLHNSRFKEFFQHLRTQGKAHKVAMTACMRKLLVTLNQMIKTNQTWIEKPTAATS